MRSRLVAFVIATIGSSAAPSQAFDDVVAKVMTQPPYSVGSPIEIELAIANASNSATFPKAPLDLGAFVIVAESAPSRATRRYAVVPALSGEQRFPSLPVTFESTGDTVSSAPLDLVIESKMPPGPPRLVDGLEPIRPNDEFDALLPLLIALGLVIVLTIAVRRSRRRVDLSADGGMASTRSVFADDAARELAELEARLGRLGDPEATSTLIAASVIVRVAIERATAFPALRRTTEEIGSDLLSARNDCADGLLSLLSSADDAKYGGSTFTVESVREHIASARVALARFAPPGGGAR